MKNFIYLLQGESKFVNKYFHLAERKDADAIFLTYDNKIDNAIFFPNSTWSEGRNKLLDAARKKGNYHYYIFCDDDIEFRKGSWDEFEELLILHKPAIGFPVVPCDNKIKINLLDLQLNDSPDQQMIAFHRDLIEDNLILPYQEHLDNICMWGSGGVIQQIIPNLYKWNSIQFNTVVIRNLMHSRYDRTNLFKNLQVCINWFRDETTREMKIVNKNKYGITLRKIIIMFKTILYLLKYQSTYDSYRVDEDKIQKLFKINSVFYKQYRCGSER